MKKIYFISFASIFNHKFANSYYNAYLDAARKLDDNYHFYFLNSDLDKDNIHHVPKVLSILIRCILYICRKINIPYYYSLTISVLLYDYYLAWVLKKEKQPISLVSCMYSPKCAEVVHSMGGKVAFIGANHDDNLYFRCVKREKKRLGLSYIDVYDSKYRNRIYNRMLQNVDIVASTNNLVLRYYPNRCQKVLLENTFSPNGFGVKTNFYQGNGVFTIGYIGHTVLLKGLHILAEAISKSAYQERLKLVVCGPVDSHVKHIVDKYNINIQYLGFVSNSDRNVFFKSSDLIVVPSLYDAGPNTVLEALECGVPVILSSGCGLAEIFEGYEDISVFKTGDVEELKKKIDNSLLNYRQQLMITKAVKQNFFAKNRSNSLTVIDFLKCLRC